MIEEFLRNIKNTPDLFSKLDAIYTSKDRRYIRHLKCILLELSYDFIENMDSILKENLVEERNIKFTPEILDKGLLRVHFFRQVRYGKKIDNNALIYIINNDYAAIFFSSDLNKGFLLQKTLLKIMYPFWRRVVITEEILRTMLKKAEIEVKDSLENQPTFDGWEEKRKIWKKASLRIPLVPYGLKLIIANDGTIGLISGSIQDLLRLFMEAIIDYKKRTENQFSLNPIHFSAIGIPLGEALELKFSEPFSENELHNIIHSISEDHEDRFLVSTLQSVNPFLQLNVMEITTGSVFMFAAIEDSIRIVPTSEFSVQSLRSLVETIFTSVGAPKELNRVQV